MKFALIAAAILSSSAAYAADTSAHVFFKADHQQAAQCSINVLQNEANLAFTEADLKDAANMAAIEVSSDFANKIIVKTEAAWSDVSAWGGNNPNTTLHTRVEGDMGNTESTIERPYYTEEYNLAAKGDQKSLYLLSAMADKMTHTGSARLDAVVQFECE